MSFDPLSLAALITLSDDALHAHYAFPTTPESISLIDKGAALEGN